MGATTIFFNGRVISVPGSYSEVDTSGLETVGLSAVGIIGLLGTSEGGTPVTAMTEPKDFIRLKNPDKVASVFRSGDLLEAAAMLFAPAKDPNVPGGAVEIVAMKVNPATQGTATFANAQGNALLLTSKDYGAFVNQINIAIATGTTKGKLLTIKFEDITEGDLPGTPAGVDDLGGDNIFTLQYTPGTEGWLTTMTAQVLTGGDIEAKGTRASVGKDGDITVDLAANRTIRVFSSAAGDTTQKVRVYGLSGGLVVMEELSLNGTTIVTGTTVFDTSGVLGAEVIGTTAGTVTVEDSGGTNLDVFVISAGANQSKGLIKGTAMYVAGVTITVELDAAGAQIVLLEGKNAAGLTVREKITLNGTTPVVTTTLWSEITRVILGDVPAARTVTLKGTAAKTLVAVQKTVTQAKDYFNARKSGANGFTWVTVTSKTGFLVADLDVQSAATTILSVATGYKADLFAIIDWITTNSTLLKAEKVAGAKDGFPDNTSSPTFLTGGGEGTTVFANWQTGLNLLKKVRVNTIVALTGDPAVHAAVDAHCAYMGGVGRSERDGVVGIQNAALTNVPLKSEIKSQIVTLNSRHLRAVGQAIERFDTAGVRKEFMPHFLAAVIAGADAGSGVGESLTFKYMNVLSLRQDSSWNPTDDAEEMIQAGLCFLELVDGVGRRVVRNVTTHLSTSNIAFTEASVNEAVNFAVFNFRTNMEFAVGKKGFSGTINAGKAVAIGTLGLMVDAAVLVTYRSLFIELIVDVMEVSVEVAPVIPINFVKNTIHLVTVKQSAA